MLWVCPVSSPSARTSHTLSPRAPSGVPPHGRPSCPAGHVPRPHLVPGDCGFRLPLRAARQLHAAAHLRRHVAGNTGEHWGHWKAKAVLRLENPEDACFDRQLQESTAPARVGPGRLPASRCSCRSQGAREDWAAALQPGSSHPAAWPWALGARLRDQGAGNGGELIPPPPTHKDRHGPPLRTRAEPEPVGCRPRPGPSTGHPLPSPKRGGAQGEHTGSVPRGSGAAGPRATPPHPGGGGDPAAMRMGSKPRSAAMSLHATHARDNKHPHCWRETRGLRPGPQDRPAGGERAFHGAELETPRHAQEARPDPALLRAAPAGPAPTSSLDRQVRRDPLRADDVDGLALVLALVMQRDARDSERPR